jgi:FAD/FMN-containing dehydrogenase
MTVTETSRPLDSDNLAVVAALQVELGADRVETGEAACMFFATDISHRGATALAVVRPGTVEQVATAARICADAGLDVIPRGGGFSYTRGYVSESHRNIVFDLRDLNTIIEINDQDMYVVVETGCTWQKLYEVLKAHNVRTPYFGPMSGYHATVGGALSQGSFFLGSSQFGPVAESVLAVEVVLADGDILRTGSWGTSGHEVPFFRTYGPDLTGLFLGDTGAFGFKTRAVLKLIPFPAHTRFASFAFNDQASAARLLSAVSRLGIASECYCWDPYFVKIMASQSASLMQDLRLLAGVARGQSGTRGLFNAARLALSGKAEFEGTIYMLNITLDDISAEGADARLRTVRTLSRDHDAREITPSAPMAMRGTPFIDFNTADRRSPLRNLPTNGLVPHSRVAALCRDVQVLLADNAAEMSRLGIECGTVYFGVGQQAMCVEPIFYWDDAQHFEHNRVTERSNVAAIKGFAEQPAATKLAFALRKKVSDIMTAHGSAHVQIGRSYPWLATRSAPAAALVRAIKRQLDPKCHVNPGSLGLEHDDGATP